MRRKLTCRHQMAGFQRGNTICFSQYNWRKKWLWHKQFFTAIVLHRNPFPSYWRRLPMWYNTGKQNADAIKPWLDKRLHFPFLEKGAMPSATDCPPTHNCTLKISYRTGGNNQLGPQEKAHQQFRHSAARNRTHRPVHSPRHPGLLRERKRSAGVPGVACSAWSG